MENDFLVLDTLIANKSFKEMKSWEGTTLPNSGNNESKCGYLIQTKVYFWFMQLCNCFNLKI